MALLALQMVRPDDESPYKYPPALDRRGCCARRAASSAPDGSGLSGAGDRGPCIGRFGHRGLPGSLFVFAPLKLDAAVPGLHWLPYGVDLFFILSGFILTHVHGEDFPRLHLGGWARFLKLRLARLYPVHLLTLVALVPVALVAPRLRLPESGGRVC